MDIQKFENEKFVCLIAPDGTWQPSMMAPDIQTCMAFIKLLHKKGLGYSLSEYLRKGFMILPISVTIIPTDNEKASNKN